MEMNIVIYDIPVILNFRNFININTRRQDIGIGFKQEFTDKKYLLLGILHLWYKYHILNLLNLEFVSKYELKIWFGGVNSDILPVSNIYISLECDWHTNELLIHRSQCLG